MRILGVDPGIATVGFAVLDAEKRSQRLLTCGVITTPAKTQLSSRLDQIYRDLNELIAQAGGRRLWPCGQKAGHGHGASHPVPAGRAEAGRRGGRRRYRALPCAQRHIFDPSTGEV